MHERAKKLGGDLRISSAPGAGTEVWVDVPA
jgi:signal transduction histidine kinase